MVEIYLFNSAIWTFLALRFPDYLVAVEVVIQTYVKDSEENVIDSEEEPGQQEDTRGHDSLHENVH